MKTVLIIGSFNGQDSFGDKCLARCVARQIRNIFGEETEIVSHIDENIEISRKEIPEIDFQVGFSRLYWSWNNKLRHLHLPLILQRLISFITLPVYLISTRENRQDFQRINRQIIESPIVYFYGGTQLSEQWFWYNFIPLIFTAILCKFHGVPFYFGPQQYGPENKWQRLCLAWARKYLICDIRVRNKNCLEMLNLSLENLCYDEVFSCAIRYPIIKHHIRPKSFILVNIRGTNFLKDREGKEFQTEDEELKNFLNLLVSIQEHLRLPFKLFQMSGDSFCDDTKLLDFLRINEKKYPLKVELLPLFVREEDLIDLASQAYGTISMSFHGCILSMIGGCPSIPVTLGNYYDYKYIDFDKYTGGQGVPLITLSDLDVEMYRDKICDYLAEYSVEKNAEAREIATKQIESWYHKVGGN